MRHSKSTREITSILNPRRYSSLTLRSLAAFLLVCALGLWTLLSGSSDETRALRTDDAQSAKMALNTPVANTNPLRAVATVPRAVDLVSTPPGTVASRQRVSGGTSGSSQSFEAGALSCRLHRDSSERISLRDCAGSPLLDRGEQGARALLAELAPAFGFPADLSDLELVDEKHGLGSSRTLFRQTLNGLPVYDSSVSINQGADGSLQAAYSNYQPLNVGSLIPDLTSAQSEAIARAEGGLVTTRLPTVSELVWHSQFKGVGRLAWKSVIYSEEPLGDFLTLVDAETGKVLMQENRIAFDTGSGFVFDPNPIQTSGNTGLSDSNDATSAALDAERSSVTLLGLDSATGTLKGEFIDLVSLAGGKPNTPDADEPSRVYQYDRSNARFEQVVIYYAVDSIQRYFHSLGFDDDVGIANGIRDFPTLANAHWDNADQSFYSTGDNAIHFGDGGVDDGEDADIIAHEFGHAVQHDQNACWGGGDMGAMGEGFGDYLAASFYADGGDATHQAAHAACVGEWDASSYSSASPPCLRRVDGTKTYPGDLVGSVHADGEIWSAALWEIRSQLGATTTDTLVLEHHFNIPCSATMTDAATELLQADVNLNSGSNQSAIRQTFCDRGILSGAACAAPSNLTLSYALSPDPPISGQTATLTLTAANSSPDLLPGIQLAATIPAGTNYIAGSASNGGSEAGGTVSWPATDISGASQVQRSFEVLLDAGLGKTTLFEDDMESGSAGWTVSHGSGTFDWALGTGSPRAGTYAFFASEPAELTDQYLALAGPVGVTAGTALRLWHSYDTERTFDGGVIEISTDGGVTWSDIGAQITQNGYDGTISNAHGSPIGGRAAFTGNSNGYLETVADLSLQAGQSVLLRLRLASDNSVGGNGWWVDDVTIGNHSTLTSAASASGSETANTVLRVDIQGAPANSNPVIAANTGLSVDEAATAPISSSDLRISDGEQAASALTLTVTTAPTRGSLNLGSVFTQQQIDEGLLAYTHDGTETTSDSFSFSVSDGVGGTTVGTFTIGVTPVNDPPLAVSDSVVVAEGASTTTLSDGLTTSVLANDTDSDLPGDSLTAVVVNNVINGSLTFNSDGSFFYVHNGTETAADSFEYQVSDGTEVSSSVTVTIAVSATNDLPDLGLSSLPDATAGLNYEVTFTPSDPDETDTLTVVALSSPAWLDTLVDHGDGSWSLSGTPQLIDEGTANVTLRVSDSAVPAGEQEATLTIMVLVAPAVPTLLPGRLSILALMLVLSGTFALTRGSQLEGSSN